MTMGGDQVVEILIEIVIHNFWQKIMLQARKSNFARSKFMVTRKMCCMQNPRLQDQSLWWPKVLMQEKFKFANIWISSDYK
jgi:hypothetical protein